MGPWADGHENSSRTHNAVFEFFFFAGMIVGVIVIGCALWASLMG